MTKKNKKNPEALLEEIRKSSGLDSLEQGLLDALEKIKKRVEKTREAEEAKSED